MEFCLGTFNSPFASSVHWQFLFKRYIERTVLTRKKGNTNGIIFTIQPRTKAEIREGILIYKHANVESGNRRLSTEE